MLFLCQMVLFLNYISMPNSEIYVELCETTFEIELLVYLVYDIVTIH